MKGIARSIAWWPGLDKNIEETVRSVHSANNIRRHQHYHYYTHGSGLTDPGHICTMIMLGHSKYFLVLVDAHSKWMEVLIVPSTSTSCTIQKLRGIFATHGLPETLVSDNATCFTSSEFKEFVTRNGIRHITSAPYLPATNGLAERAVQTFKSALKKTSVAEIETQLSRFLFRYRNTPHSTTGTSPAELLLGRRPRSLLTLMQPNTSTRDQNQHYHLMLTIDLTYLKPS